MNRAICGALALACLWPAGARADTVWLVCSFSEVRRPGLAGVYRDGTVLIGFDEAKKTVDVLRIPDFMRDVPKGLQRSATAVNDARVFVAYKAPWPRGGPYPDGTFFALTVSVNRIDGAMALRAGPYKPISPDQPNKWGPATHDLDEMSQAHGTCSKALRDF